MASSETAVREKIPILLLKSKSQPHDSYEEYFSSTPNGTSFSPTFVPVLEHRYNSENLEQVKDLLLSGALTGPDKQYGGLIFTSQRAVEGFARVVQEVGPIPDDNNNNDITIYVVGPATSRSLRTLCTTHLPHTQILGSETGNGENLAHFILSHYNSIPQETQPDNKLPLLFLVGEQRRDIIPKTLMSPTLDPSERIPIDDLALYETAVMASFPTSFASALEANTSSTVIWVVVFSPTGCEVMLRSLGILDEGSGRRAKDAAVLEAGKERRRHFIATIGPTTRDYLVKTFGFEPDVCAERPSPEGVGDGIGRFMDQLG